MLPLLELTFQTILLGMEAHSVIGLRMKRMAAGGPAAIVEANQMVTEKVAALTDAAVTFMSGGSIQTVIGRFRTQVLANERRLLG